MFVTIDAGGMTIRKADLHGIVAHDRCRLRCGLRLEHRKRRKCVGGRRRSGEGFFFAALIITCSAGTLFAQIRKIVVAGVAIGPGDVNSRASFDVHLHGRRLSSRIDWNRHFEYQLGSQAASNGRSSRPMLPKSYVTLYESSLNSEESTARVMQIMTMRFASSFIRIS